jgi:hypothetical protein
MASTSEALATRLEDVSKEFESKLQSLNAQELQAKTPEGWTVAACAHHAAISSGPLSMMVAAAAGKAEMPGITADQLNEMNAQHAQQFAGASKEETLAALHETVPQAAGVVRGLSDDELQKKAMLPFGMEMTAQQIIENVLIGHLQQHTASIGAAVPA